MRSIISSNQIRPVARMKQLSEDHLIGQAKSGCEDAYVELWSRHGQQARILILRIVRNREDAEDVLQDTYLKSFLHLVTFQSKSAFSTWLCRIAINSALMFLRKRRYHPEVFVESSNPDFVGTINEVRDSSECLETCILRLERLERMRMAIERLPPKLRRVVKLRGREELALEEIAYRVNVSVGAVKARLSRARAILRESIAGDPRTRHSNQSQLLQDRPEARV